MTQDGCSHVKPNAHKLSTGLLYVLLFSDFAHSLGGGWGRNEHYLVTKVRKGSRRGDGAGRFPRRCVLGPAL